MPRLARLVPLPAWVPDGPLFLIEQRGHQGVGQSGPWLDAEDEQSYLQIFFEAALGQGLRVHAWGLFAHSALWLVRPLRPRAVAETLQQVGRRYVRLLNVRWGRSGSPWAGRYRSCWVDEALSLQVTQFIDLNSGAGGLIGIPRSTADLLAGRIPTARLPAWRPPSGYWSLGNTPFERERAYQALLEAPVAPDFAELVRRGLAQGLPVLSDALWQRLPPDWQAYRGSRPVGRPRKPAPTEN